MPTQDIVSSITVIEQASQSPAGFGVPIVGVTLTAPQDALWGVSLIREFAQDTWPTELTDLGFVDGDPLWEWMTFAFQQELVPEKILVGKEASPKVAQVTNFDLGAAGSAADGNYTITINGENFTHAASSQTRAQVITAMIALFPGGAPSQFVTGSGGGGPEDLDLTADQAGVSFTFAATAPVGETWTVNTSTPNVGLTSDLLAWEAERSDWYEVNELTGDIAVIASLGPVVASFTRDIIAIGSSNSATDPTAKDGTSSTRGAALITSFQRLGIAYRESATERPLAALVAKQLPKDPGSTTWSQQSLRGFTGDTFTATETNALLGEGTNPGNYIYFEAFPSLSLPISRNARMGDRTPIDLIRGRDWINQQIQIDVLAFLVAEEKVPYTDTGAGQIANVIRDTLAEAIRRGIGVANTAVVTFDPRSVQLPADIAARVWKGFRWTLQLSGAIESVEISGVLAIV